MILKKPVKSARIFMAVLFLLGAVLLAANARANQLRGTSSPATGEDCVRIWPNTGVYWTFGECSFIRVSPAAAQTQIANMA